MVAALTGSVVSAEGAEGRRGASRPSADAGGYRSLSLWHATVPDPLEPRPALAGDLDVDVAIVGAGYTGLWTAYYLLGCDPTLRVAVLEREIAGFGASGRNGGWCSGLFPAPPHRVASLAGRTAALRQVRALRSAVLEVGRVCQREEIDAHYAHGGSVLLARSAVQLARARDELAEARTWGDTEADLALVGPREAAEVCGATSVRAALVTPHCAAIHPARLVRGLATAAERRGVSIYERTPVLRLDARGAQRPSAVTPTGAVRADVVVRATEGYTAALPGLRRVLAPVYSLMVASDPLPAAVWDQIGLRRRQTFSDLRHLIIYGQRTADDRLAFGGRGAPYHPGSGVRPEYEREPHVFAELRRVLRDLFPVLDGVEFPYAWGGPLGVPRDWIPSVGIDRGSGLAWAGGYVGDGVAASHLAGRTLAELITRTPSERTELPWVGHRSPRWEPEPLRWLGVTASLRVMYSADRVEERTGRPARRARIVNRLTGH